MWKMDAVELNPCLACTTGQDCCRNLCGLRLSEDEYRRHFERHSPLLTVRRDGRLWQVTARGGGPCPNWDGACTVYADRPMECRLFPYTLGGAAERGGSVTMRFHAHTRCPLKDSLIMPRAEAESMVLAFARRVFADKDDVTVEFQPPFTRWRRGIATGVARRLRRATAS